jgi:hypothetical protein
MRRALERAHEAFGHGTDDHQSMGIAAWRTAAKSEVARTTRLAGT